MVVHALLMAAALAPTNTSWEAGVATSYVRGGSFDGPGIAAYYLYVPSDYFALGPMVDVAYLSSGLKAANGLPASYAFTSTFAGGLAQLRLTLRLLQPYAWLALFVVGAVPRPPVNALVA